MNGYQYDGFHISKVWGITEFNVKECENMVAEWFIPDDCGVKYIPNHGPSFMANRWPCACESLGVGPSLLRPSKPGLFLHTRYDREFRESFVCRNAAVGEEAVLGSLRGL